jgi:5-methylcytosine-specific restriction endonuclease McrA
MDKLAEAEVGDPHVGSRGRAVAQARLHAVNGHGGRQHRVPGISSRVLVLNASYEPINVCTVRRATVLVLKARAEVLEEGEGALHSERLELARPCVIRLIRYVRIPRDVHGRKITRKAVLARDAYTCQYCGHEASGLTVDHVIPRSRGGESSWDNIVASCAPCNRKKGNRLPREVSMHPRKHPRPPGPTVFIRIASPRIPNAWEPYLVAA